MVSCRTSDICVSAVSSRHAHVKPKWLDVINMAGFLDHIKGHGAGILFHQGLRAWMCSPRLSSRLYEGEEGSLFPPCLKYFFSFRVWHKVGVGIKVGHVEWVGYSGGSLLVPDVWVKATWWRRAFGTEVLFGTSSCAVKQATTSVFTQNNQGPTLQAAWACY